MSFDADVIVVGSGASGVNAAWPLVSAGYRVLMLDVGIEDTTLENLVPAQPFVELRRQDDGQHRYFLGDDYRGVAFNAVDSGPQITPPRSFVTERVADLTPRTAHGIEPIESLAAGGLGRVWGSVSFPFLPAELLRCGLPATEMCDSYERVAQRIGVSGQADDDLQDFHGPLRSLQPASPGDHNAVALLARYTGKRREQFRDAGFRLGRSWLANLSQDLDGRRANALNDMDFWSNSGDSVYRPQTALRRLLGKANFCYQKQFLVETFAENSAQEVQIRGRSLDTNSSSSLFARALVLAAGPFGTARIVLRSGDHYDRPLQFCCNPHTYMPSWNWRQLGRPHADACHSLAQLTVIGAGAIRDSELTQAQMYSYRSLMLFRLAAQSPLGTKDSLRLFRDLTPSLAIWAIQHADRPSRDKYCVLKRGGGASPSGDQLHIHYRRSAAEDQAQDDIERRLARSLRQLGCWPLRRVPAGHGASAHYGSLLPMTDQDKPLTTRADGLLRGTRSVYIADASTLAYLPAKGPTLTLMANADRIGSNLARLLATGSSPSLG